MADVSWFWPVTVVRVLPWQLNAGGGGGHYGRWWLHVGPWLFIFGIAQQTE